MWHLADNVASGAPANHGLDELLGSINEILGLGVNIGAIRITVGSLLAALVVIVLTIIVASVLRRGLLRYGKRHDSNQSAVYTVSRVLHYSALTIGFLWALSVAGVPLSKFVVFFGALGVGIGIGLQGIVSNFIAGLVILFDRSLTVGDYIELPNGTHGRVRDIQIRATRVTTTDNIDIMVPNASFITDNVVNYTWRDVSRRMQVHFRVPYGTDKALVRELAQEAAATVPYTVTDDEKRKPDIWLTNFGESALEFALVVWLNENAARRNRSIQAAYRWALHDALEKYGLELPFPQRDVHVKTWNKPADS